MDVVTCTPYAVHGFHQKQALTPALGLTTSVLISLLTPSTASLDSTLDTISGALDGEWKAPSAMLEDVFVGEDENAARRGGEDTPEGSDGVEGSDVADGLAVEDKKTQ